MKKIFCFIMLCLWFIGIAGGIGYTVYQGAWLIAIGVAAAGWMSWPRVYGFFKILTE